MTRPTLLRTARKHVKEYAAAVIAANLIFGGVKGFISVLKYPLADGSLRLINAVILKGFRNRMPLSDPYGGLPWWFYVGYAAEGAIAITLGILVGLWANSREQRRPTPGP